MANTTNLNLVKPAGTDYALVSVINGNMDIIDSKVGAIPANESAQSQITALNNQIGTFVPSKVLNGSATSYSIPNNCRATIIGISSNEAYCYMLIVSSSSGGVVHVADVYKGSSIAYDKSVSNKLTFSTNADKMLIFASSNEILNGIS